MKPMKPMKIALRDALLTWLSVVAGVGIGLLVVRTCHAAEPDVVPFEILAPDASITVNGVHIARGHDRYFRAAHGPAVFVVRRADGSRDGFAQGARRLKRYGHVYAPFSPPSFRCEPPRPVPLADRLPRATTPTPPPYTLRLAVLTDYELWQNFGTDAATRDYVLQLLAGVSAIYHAELQTDLQVADLRLWSTPSDPWTATDTGAQLDEVTAYGRDATHGLQSYAGTIFLSGKPVRGGIAWLNVLCNPTYDYAVVQVFGSLTSSIWDTVATAHELGHVVASPHTHCYTPPVDTCWNGEPCYTGPVTCTRGTIMSYCHLCSTAGLANLDLRFGPVVDARLTSGLSSAACTAAAPRPSPPNLRSVTPIP